MTSSDQIIYLDNAATTFPKPESVYVAMDQFYRNYGGNAGRGANPLARRAAGLLDETRTMLKEWLNVPDAVFMPSATIALNTAILGAGLRSGDVVYVTPFEHNSVLRPLEYLRKTKGIRIEVLPFDRQTMECKLDEVTALFKLDPPAMVCASLVSNVVGLILPIDELTAMAKRASSAAITIIDGAQAAGLLEVDTSRVDALIFSGHKSLYGPYGIAGIGFGTDWRPEPIIMGGTGTQSELIDMPQSGSSRYEAGSHNVQAVAGLNASLKWLRTLGRQAIVQHTYDLTMLCVQSLSELPNIILHIPHDAQNQFGVISFGMSSIMPQAIETALGAQDIAVRAGLHCSPWTHDFINTRRSGGTIRVSFSHFNAEHNPQQLQITLSKIKY